MNTASAPTNSSTRKGNVLVLAVILLGAAMAMIVQSTDSVSSTYKQMKQKLMEQKTIAAAEAVAARFEYEVATYQPLQFSGWNNYGQQWFGDCLVKYRIEPAVIYTPTNPGSSSSAFIANTPSSDLAVIPAAPQQPNPDLSNFRIATEATYSEGGIVRCKAQAIRMLQYSQVRLFRYAIFYGQTGPAGDIEFAHGPDLTVLGGVHSNGAIYIGGSSGPTGTNVINVQGGGKTIIGSATTQVAVTAVDGIYRQNKRYNYHHKGSTTTGGYTGPDPLNPDPMKITDPALISNQDNRTINGVNLTKDKDSLGDANFVNNSQASAPTGWGGWLRTSKTKATVINSLANIPTFAGRPLEPQRLNSPAGVAEWQWRPLYGVAATYKPNFLNVPTTTAPAAADLPYCIHGNYLDYALGSKDCLGTGRTDQSNIATTNNFVMHLELISGSGTVSECVPIKAGLIIRERPNGLQAAWDGTKGTNTPPDLPPTDVTGTVRIAGNDVPYATVKTSYANYMISRYQVFLGRLDITNEFFKYPSAAQAVAGRRFVATANKATPTATEDFFYNQREYYSQGTKAWTDTSIQRQSVLTLNMDAVQDFIRDTVLGGASGIAAWNLNSGRDALNIPYLATSINGNTAAANTDTIRQHFNGLIYVHRTDHGGAYTAARQPLDFSNGVRLANGRDISWDHAVAPTVNPLGTSKLTIATPNQAFILGDFNKVLYPDSAGTNQQTPLALMCDMLTVQSNSWSDANQNQASVYPTSNGWRGASNTTYNVALVVNNAPTVQAYKYDDASVHTFAWYMENWSGTTFNYKGSIVVLNARRYCRGFNEGADRIATSGTDLPPDRASPAPALYGAPTRNITFNNDLLTNAGTPPFVLPAYALSRQFSYSYVVMAR